MGQHPVPTFRVYGLLAVVTGLALVSTITASSFTAAKADPIVTQESSSPKVDLDVLNANLLSVVQVLKMKSQAQIVVEGGDKAYSPVSLTVSGSLAYVLGYVAESAGATLTRNDDGVYVLRPIGAPAPQDAVADTTPKVTPAVDTTPAVDNDPVGPLHVERIQLQWRKPADILRYVGEPNELAAANVMYNDTNNSWQQDAKSVSVTIPQTPFSLSKANTNSEAVQTQVVPSVPTSMNGQTDNSATQANDNTTVLNNQAQQFVPPFQQGQQGAGGFGQPGGFGGAGGVGGPGGANAQAASLRPKGITSIIADSQDNSLLVQGDAEGIQELRQIIQLLDIPAKQVQIKAEFITASVTTVDQFGINFQLVPAPNISTAFTGSTVTGSTVVEFSQGNLVAEMQAQLSTDASKVVSAPLVTTTNNTSATIQFNEQIPYNTSSTAVNGSGTATTSTAVGFLSVSSGLTVQPQVNGDNSVTMDVTLPNTTTNPSADTSLPPTTTTQLIHTVRTVANGETMVLGGLVSKNDSNARVYVPFLGNLPIIGSLFRTRNLNDADTELLIFITPTVLPYPGQYETPTPAIDTGVGVTP